MAAIDTRPVDSAQAISVLRARLTSARNADGGWAYYAGKTSRLEPTCWSLLAMRDVSSDVLREWPSADGLLLERREGQPNFGFHGLALLTLLDRKIEHRDGNAALVAGIQRAKGVALGDSRINRQNNGLQAWSWMGETFSWVEPTTYCLLALKKAQRAGLSVDGKRVADAEALMFDRCGVTGGWNYGNSNMLGKELPAYVPTTALGLLSLQDRSSDDAVRRSLDYLERDALSERSGLALSLAMIALRVFQRPVDAISAALVQQLPTTLALGNLHAAALALYALRTDHADAALVLQ
jgi:hypothetical protein